MMNQPGAGANMEAQLRLLRILWAAFLTTIGLYVLVTLIALPGAGAQERAERDNPALLLGLGAVALTTVALSFVLKKKMYGEAAGRRDPARFQTGFIIALALAESAALFGVVALFVTLNSYAYLFLVLGGAAIALHFPRRDELATAYYGRR